ncbi:hypothetical protein A2U01_0059843 [Trifolium medium]|uniref:Uncharacterized protein n=1 Tax=Trifolium medium TaxID=97028 RepID=A0A392RSQ1_9FABA|nr:hypothetical protein [Trifolium medium]
MDINYNDFDLVIEQAVDFEALKVNGFDVEHFFTDQVEAERGYALKVAEDVVNNKGKSR